MGELGFRNMKNKIHFLTQSIKLTRLGSPAFDNVIAVLKEICQMGERSFHDSELQPWHPQITQGPKTRTSEEEGIPLSQEVDPNSTLGRMAGNMLMHMKDNVVSYFKAIIEEGKKKYIKARPQMFRAGDIVKVQCSMVFFKTKNGVARMKTVL
ncbi:hypothetical protein ARMSODRAFT_982661 [Armillaria solidipes]|uniref:Uncharacterized protein n=1 Tax=Armillaria solidipes TaxID=1076256 RepID=A0A2H3AYS9_9AGAR|nr:hypothetical protein ARMSODRAFT_982661 [Armillaria solidipes]